MLSSIQLTIKFPINETNLPIVCLLYLINCRYFTKIISDFLFNFISFHLYSTGSGRTGVFICLSILLDRMRSEGMVDMFLITRMLRTQRINTIQTSDQYAFCYAATLEYLASFDHYMS